MRGTRKSAKVRPLEVELKLRVEPAALEQLATCDILGSSVERVGPALELQSTYYDTGDHRLAKRGLTLRVRRIAPRRFVQTIKLEPLSPGTILERPEWEQPLRSSHPDPTALAAIEAEPPLDAIAADELLPVYSTLVMRRSMEVRWPDAEAGDARIELILDRGRITAGRKRAPLAEIELELLEGPPRALVSLARWLREQVPFAVETLSKSTRGRLLAEDVLPASRTPPRPRLDEDIDIDRSMRTILGQGLGHWLHHEAIARDGRDPEGLHQLRVAIRMLRSVLGILRPAIGDPLGFGLVDRLRALQGRTSLARDLDVIALELLAPLRAVPSLAAELAPLDGRLDRARALALAEVRQTIDSAEYRDLVTDLLFWIELGGWRDQARPEAIALLAGPAGDVVGHVLASRWRKARKLLKGFTERTAEERHAARIEVKKVRYGSMLFTDLFRARRLKRFSRRLGELQDTLGQLNDIAVVGHRLRALADGAGRDSGLTRAIGLVEGWYAASGPALLARASLLVEDARDSEPPWGKGRS